IQTGETIFNEVWAQLFGYSLAELAPVSIKTWDKLAHPEDLRKSEILLNKHFSGELPFYACECRAKHKNGNWIWINDCGRVITRSEDGKPLMMFGTHTDITNRKRVEEALHLSQEELKKFASHLQLTQDEERIGLAREIHDELAQTLIAVKIDLGLLKQKVLKNTDNADISDILIKFDQLFGLVNYTIKTTGNIMTGLRPEALYLLGLIEAISLHINKFGANHQIDCHFENSVVDLVVNTQQSLALFRILQEALENIALHSKAKTVKIHLSTEINKLVLKIIDNGIGFDENMLVKSETYGLIGMKERARFVNGEFSIIGILGNGTTVKVEIPY
ncbi:MAG: PAS domain-containing protein, partial [Paludibacter sp.]